MQKIIIRRRATGWTADFVGDISVRRTFGTTELPTPFTPSATAEYVIAEVQAKNPECEIYEEVK